MGFFLKCQKGFVSVMINNEEKEMCFFFVSIYIRGVS